MLRLGHASNYLAVAASREQVGGDCGDGPQPAATWPLPHRVSRWVGFMKQDCACGFNSCVGSTQCCIRRFPNQPSSLKRLGLAQAGGPSRLTAASASECLLGLLCERLWVYELWPGQGLCSPLLACFSWPCYLQSAQADSACCVCCLRAA